MKRSIVGGQGVTGYKFALQNSSSCEGAAYTDTFAPVSQRIASPLGADGSKTVCVLAQDAAGNVQSTPTSYTWVKTTVLPIAELSDTPLDPSAATALNVLVGGAGVTQYKFALRDAANCDGASYSDFKPATERIGAALGNDGAKTLCVLGKDAAENVQATPTAYTWVKDTVSPIAALTGEPTDPSRDTQLNVTVSGDRVTHYKYRLLSSNTCTGAVYGDTWIERVNPTTGAINRITGAIGLDGPKALCVIAKDALGNVQAQPTTRFWTKDLAAPEAVLTGTPAQFSRDTQLNVTVSGEGVVSFQYVFLNAPSCSSANFTGRDFLTAATAKITDAIVADGSKALCVKARDQAGNVQGTATQHTWTKDTSLPNAVLEDTPTNPSAQNPLNIKVAGLGVSEYQYAITQAADCSAVTYSAFRPVSARIQDPVPTEVPRTLCVKGKNQAGNIQSGTTQFKWVKSDVVASLSALPAAGSTSAALTIDAKVSGDGVTEYAYVFRSTTSTCTGVAQPTTFSPIATRLQVSAVGADGAKVICLWGKNSAGKVQVAPTQHSWTKDTVAPIAVLTDTPLNPSAATVLNVLVGGTGAGGSYKFKVLDGDGCVGGTYSNEFIPITTRITQALGSLDGIKSLCVIARDAAGNIQATETKYTWDKDTTRPIASFSGTPSSPSKAGTLNVTVGGTGITHYQFKLLNAQDCSGGSFGDFLPIATPITQATGDDGAKILCVKGKNAAGLEQGTPSRHIWVKDTVAPEAVLTGTPVNPSKDSVTNVTVGGAQVAQYQFQLLSGNSCENATLGSFVPVATKISVPIDSEGSKILCVKGRDAAGNVQQTMTQYTWVKDSIAPSAELSNKPAEYSRLTILDVGVTGTGVTTYRFALVNAGNCDAAPYGTADIPVATKITNTLGNDGTKTLCVKGKDAAGNTQATPTVHTWTKDTVAPTTVTLSNLPASGDANLNVTVGGADVFSYKFVLLTTNSCTTATYSAAREVGTPITGAIGAAGPKYLCVKGIDRAGNEQATPKVHSWNKL